MAVSCLKTEDLKDLKELTESLFYLDENQEPILKSWKAKEVIKHLPCWVPQRWISYKLFGSSGEKTVLEATQTYGPYLWATQFSNVHSTFVFADVKIVVNDVDYPGVEQYFQLQKSAGLEGHERIFEEMKTATPDDAFGIGRKDWEERKDQVMEDACRAKFSQYPELKELLLATHPFKLVQLKPGDGYWGTGKDSKGKNALGVILEKIREEMLEELRN